MKALVPLQGFVPLCTFGISRPCEGTCALRPVHCTGVDSRVPERVPSSPIQGWCDTPFTGRIELVPGVPDVHASRVAAAHPQFLTGMQVGSLQPAQA